MLILYSFKWHNSAASYSISFGIQILVFHLITLNIFEKEFIKSSFIWFRNYLIIKGVLLWSLMCSFFVLCRYGMAETISTIGLKKSWNMIIDITCKIHTHTHTHTYISISLDRIIVWIVMKEWSHMIDYNNW